MAGPDPAIQGRTKGLAVLPWMAASERGHDVGRCSAIQNNRRPGSGALGAFGLFRDEFFL
jgi:hypothetical protein